MKRRIVNYFRQFKEPIMKKELRRFLLEGLLLSTLFAAMLGALRFLVVFTPFAFLSLFVFVIYYMFLMKRLRGSFYVYHVWYSILAVLFLLIGDYIMGVSSDMITLLYSKQPLSIHILNPIHQYTFLFYWAFDAFQIAINLLSIFIYGIIIYLTYQRMK